ncbi:hypothetical protein ACTQ49_12350 [Luteococcus sp. Sow4_B9]|uniref:hypothetical protein n=1 Tax=Luteococcus sp. Sow4_B9 TaxID=3438792 RepID=UPI003F9AB0FA
MNNQHDWDDLDPRSAALFAELRMPTDEELNGPAPEEIRRRGDRRRTRRRAATAGSGLVACLAVAAVLPLSGLGRTTPVVVQPAGSASPPPATPPPATPLPARTTPRPSGEQIPATRVQPEGDATGVATGSPITWRNVPDASQILAAGAGGLQVLNEVEWDGFTSPQAALSACERNRYGLGQQRLLERALGGEASVQVSVYEFETSDQASASHKTISDWYDDCSGRLSESNATAIDQDALTDAPVGQLARSVEPHEAELRRIVVRRQDGAVFDETAAVSVVGRRLTWIVRTTSGTEVPQSTPLASDPAASTNLTASDLLAR